MGVQHNKNTGGRAAAQSVDEVGQNGIQQGQAVLTALIEGVEIQRAVVQQFLGGVVDGGTDVGQLPDLGKLTIDITGAVFHLFVQNRNGVLVQLLVNAGEVDGAVQQKDFHDQHNEKR